MRLPALRLADAWVRSRLRRDEDGVALVLAIVVMVVLASILTAVLFFSAATSRDASRTNAGQKAQALAEAGLNNGLAVLNANYPDAVHTYPGNHCLLSPQTPSAGFPGSAPPWGSGDPAACGSPAPNTYTPDSTKPNEKAVWWGTMRSVPGLGIAWVITSTGSISNPTGPGANDVSRTMTVDVPVIVGPNSPADNTSALNYIFAHGDLTFSNSVSIGSPVYTEGNLNLSQGASMLGSAGYVAVGKYAYLNTKSNSAGTNGDKIGWSNDQIQRAFIHQGCYYAGQAVNGTTPLDVPCTDLDNVYVNPAYGSPSNTTKIDTTWPPTYPTTIPNPQMNCCGLSATDYKQFGFWYQFASPGPDQPCDPATKVGTPPTFDTGDNAINNSATPAAAVNLTPWGSPYTCRTVAGEISWDGAGNLVVEGTVYIDGSAYVSNTGAPGNTVFKYTGQGVLYLSGTFLLKGTKLCVVTSGGSCDFSANAWDVNKNALIIVAWGDGAADQASGGTAAVEGQGNQVAADTGIQFVGTAAFQGGLVANQAINVGQSAAMEGPMVSMYSYVSSGQSGVLTFPALQFQPSSSPGSPPPPSTLLSPRYFTGG